MEAESAEGGKSSSRSLLYIEEERSSREPGLCPDWHDKGYCLSCCRDPRVHAARFLSRQLMLGLNTRVPCVGETTQLVGRQ